MILEILFFLCGKFVSELSGMLNFLLVNFHPYLEIDFKSSRVEMPSTTSTTCTTLSNVFGILTILYIHLHNQY